MALVGHNVAYLITRSLLSLLPEGMGQRAILILSGPIGGSLLLVMLWQGNALSVPLIYTLASLFYAAEFPVLLSEISSRSMAHFAAVMSAGYLVSNPVSFLLMKGTGRLVDTTGDFRVALSVAACGFILFGLVAAVGGTGQAPNRLQPQSRLLPDGGEEPPASAPLERCGPTKPRCFGGTDPPNFW